MSNILQGLTDWWRFILPVRREAFCEIAFNNTPKPKGRPRFRMVVDHAVAYTDKQTREYEQYICDRAAEIMGDQLPTGLPVAANTIFYLPIPQSWSKKKREAALQLNLWPIYRPDMDNLEKAVFDGMNKVVYHDDSQIVHKLVTKAYAERPRTEITVDVFV